MKKELDLYLTHVKILLSSRKVQLLIITLATTLLYLQATPNQLVLDDESFVNWHLIKNLKNIPLFFTGVLPKDHLGDYRPLKGIILALNYRLWGTNSVGYIIQALLIHLMATFLVFHIAEMLIRKKYVAFFSSLVYALHPVQVEAIAFITASSDMVGIILYLLTVYSFLRWRKNKELDNLKKKGISWIILSLASFGTGLLSYEMVLTLPLLLTFYLRLLERRMWREIFIILLPFAALLGTYLMVRFSVLRLINDETYQWGSIISTIFVSLVVLLRYLQLTILPAVLRINHEIMPGIFAYRVIEIHPFTQAPQLTNPYVVVAFAVLALVAILTLKVRQRQPLVTFAVGWFFLTLLPVLNLYPLPAFMSERYLYLPLVGFSLLLGWGCYHVFTSQKFIKNPAVRSSSLVLFFGLLLFYWGRSYVRILDWRSSESLWSKELSFNPRSMLANHNLGMAYFAKADMAQAVTHLDVAAKLNWQGVPKVYLNLGKAYLAQKNYQAARNQFQLSTIFSPQFADGHFYIANADQELGNIEEAKKGYLKTLEIDPTFYDTRVQLAQLYFRQGQSDEAIAEMERVIAENRRLMPAYYDLAAILIKLERFIEARQVLEAGLAEDPQSAALRSAYDVVQGEMK